ncbi:MAG TPA: hypothetical protein PKZ42_01725 [Syntrophales bacterium]|nr:hypothetical protein [Syntrophales bacterium]
MAEYLDFKEISKTPFKTVLDKLELPYDEAEDYMKGEGFIVNTQKNLYFNPTGDDKGSVINFVAQQLGIGLRDAATWVKKLNGNGHRKEAVLPEYQLTYHKELVNLGIPEEIAQDFEIGYCKRGIMSGKIAMKIRDEKGEKVAYIGRDIDNGKYFFPKGYKSAHIYNLWRVKDTNIILTVSPLDVAKIASLGHHNVVGLITGNMTDEQEYLLKRCLRIFVLHPRPENIVKRLSKWAFVKAPDISKVSELKREDIEALY